MTSRKILVVLTFISLIACDTNELVLTNTGDGPLVNVIVEIPASYFETNEKYPIITNADTEELIPYQFVESRLSKSWTKIICQLNFEQGESKRLKYSLSSKDELPRFESHSNAYIGVSENRNGEFSSVKTHVRPEEHKAHSKPFLYQFEGPGWESNLVAFRSYFDERNGKDIFGKTETKLNLSNIGKGTNYHQLQSWGMDVLKVGNSLGAGAIGILKNDSIYRLGETKNASAVILESGPIRSIIKFSYEGWKVGSEEYNLEELVTIYANKRWYESEVKLSGGLASDTLVTGISNLKSIKGEFFKKDGWSVLYSHGKQSENKDFLGLAIMVPNHCFIDFDQIGGKEQGISHSHLAYLKSHHAKYKFRFFVGWELENNGFKKADFYEGSLKEEVNNFNSNILIEKK